jgi:ABC-type lipoprotein export system ATPase subunit
MTAEREPLVEVRGLCREHRLGSSNVRALDGVDLTVAHREFLAVTGVSGSGKSTLLHLIGGLDTPTAGSVTVAGQRLDTLDRPALARYRRTEVGFVFQSFHLVPSLTARANVELALTVQGVYGGTRRERAARAIERVGLAGRAEHRPGQLSGGEQQRVAVARAIANEPPLLLADEPTGNLDRGNAKALLELIKALQRDGTTIVLVTHDVALAERYATRMVGLADGRITAEASA